MKKTIPLTILISLVTTIVSVSMWANSLSLKTEQNISDIKELKDDLNNEIIERKDQYTQIRVDLAEINVNILYIKEMVDNK